MEEGKKGGVHGTFAFLFFFFQNFETEWQGIRTRKLCLARNLKILWSTEIK